MEKIRSEGSGKNLKNIEDIVFAYLSEKDVVRHPLVQKIIKAYDRAEQERQRKASYQRDKGHN